MTDFDFEELDKAVAGVLTIEADDTPVATEPTKPIVAPSDEVVARSAPVGPPAARRSSGRFMDVVHPSSDMRSRTTFTPPRSTSQAPVEATRPFTVPEPEEVSIEENDDTSTGFDGMSYEDSWSKPLESPFLPDAKVEKRPLGGFGSPVMPLESLEEQLLLEASDEPLLEAHTMPDPIDFAAHASALASESEDTGASLSTPQELEALVDSTEPVKQPESVEATESVPEEITELTPEAMAVSEEVVLPEEVESSPVSESISETEEQKAEVQPTPQATNSPATVGSGSITQQYTEQKSTDDVATGSIYDTESYHQALPVTVKKRSGAWIFLWILALIVFGAGAGVVFYLYILPLI